MTPGTKFKAITLWQPWASTIAEGEKTIETRRHRKFRSLVGTRIAIHAGLHIDRGVIENLVAKELIRSSIWEIVTQLPMGAMLCTADVVMAQWCESGAIPDDDLVSAALGISPPCDLLFLANVEKFKKPIPAAGHQGIWNWSVPCICRECGCTNCNPCIGADGFGCTWIEEDLCSACVVGSGEAGKRVGRDEQ